MKMSNTKRKLLEELALLQQESVNLDIKLGVVIEELHEVDATSDELESFGVREIFYEYIYE